MIVTRGYTVALIVIATFAKVFPVYVATRFFLPKENRYFAISLGSLMNARGTIGLIAVLVAQQDVRVRRANHSIIGAPSSHHLTHELSLQNIFSPTFTTMMILVRCCCIRPCFTDHL